MLKKRVLYVLLLSIGFVLNSYGQIGSVIGSTENDYNKEVPKKNRIPFSTKQLTFKIIRNATSDAEKVAAIYKWIAAHISYDDELRHNVKLQKKIYTSEENVMKEVLERKMALCGGFAFLFKDLCKNAGIPATVINGHTKDYSGKAPKNKKPDHTWNAVKLNGKWQLLDITWAISHGGTNKPDDFWFLTAPSEFIYSHYPEDPKWTLLKNPISFSEFRKIGVNR